MSDADLGGAPGRRDTRRTARLAAVQAIYQMELSGADAESVASEFIAHRFEHEPEMRPAGPADEAFFAAIVRGVPEHQVEIDKSIAKCLTAEWRLERVDSILRAILRAGAFEFIARRDVPARVVIDEYLEISHAFFSGDEPGFVNAVLDRLAHVKRAVEFGEKPPEDELQF